MLLITRVNWISRDIWPNSYRGAAIVDQSLQKYSKKLNYLDNHKGLTIEISPFMYSYIDATMM